MESRSDNDDIDAFVDRFERSLCLINDDIDGAYEEATTSKLLSETQRTIESCGWTPRSMRLDDGDGWRTMTTDAFDRALAALLRARARTKSESTLRLWWLSVLEITSARGVKSANDSSKKSDALEELCRTLVDDVARLAASKQAPDRERWGEIMEELALTTPDVATREETLALAMRALYAIAPDVVLNCAREALKSRQSQATREAVYWLLFALSAVDPVADDACTQLLRLVVEFSPMKWAPSYRKSDFRHSLSTTLTVVTTRYLSRGRPSPGSVDVAVVNKVLAEVVKWSNENEKKHNTAGLPLRAILIGLGLTQEVISADAIPIWRLLLESRVKAGIEQKMKISSLLAAIRGVVMGISDQHITVMECAKQSLSACISAIKYGSGSEDIERPLALANCVMAIHGVNPVEGSNVLKMLLDETDESIRAASCISCAKMTQEMSADEVRSSSFLCEYVDGVLPKYLTGLSASASAATIAGALQCSKFTSPKYIAPSSVEFACSWVKSDSVAVRNAVEEYLLHVIRSNVSLRNATLQAVASAVLNMRDFAPAARLSAINVLVGVCKIWQDCLQNGANSKCECSDERAEAAALLLVCDADFSVRTGAVQALREISNLRERVDSMNGDNATSRAALYPVLQKYLNITDIPTLIREISRTTALECAAVHTTTHAQAYQRIQAMMVAEGDGKLLVVPVKPSEYRYNLWQNYMLFVCSTDGAAGGGGGLDARQVVTIGQRGSLAGLLQTVIPRLGQSNVEVDAIMRLFQLVPAQSKATILSALLPLQSGLMRYTLMRRKRREDLNMVIRFGELYQDYALHGVFASTADATKNLNAAIDFVLMVCSYLKTNAKAECSPTEIVQLRFSAAAIIGAVLTDAEKVRALPVVTHAELWDNFYAWQESPNPKALDESGDSTSRMHVQTLIDDLARDHTRKPTERDVGFASREALAALSLSEHFTRESAKKIFDWVNRLAELGDSKSLELSKRVVVEMLRSTTSVFEASLDFCYSASATVSRMYVVILAEMSDAVVDNLSCPQLISLVLYMTMHEDDAIRSAAGVLLRAVNRECGLIDGHLPLQIDNKAQLIEECERLVKTDTQQIEDVLLEVWKRQLNKAKQMKSDSNPSHLSACLVPWISALHLPHLVAAGKADEVLLGLYNVMTHSDESTWAELGELWSAIGVQARNIAPTLRFLQERTITSTDRDAISFRAAKAACGWIARTSPQQVIDQLVYTISFRALESDDSDATKPLPQDSATSKISSADVGIILLSELALDHREDFRFHLPVLAHAVVVTLIVTHEQTVREHCGELLCNLAMGQTSEIRALKKKSPAYRLGKLFVDDSSQAWTSGKIRTLINTLPHAIDLDENLPQRWANEARRWILRSPSFSLACASAETLMSLNVPLDDEAFEALLAATCMCASMSGEVEDQRNNEMSKKLTQHLLKTLGASLCDMSAHATLMYTQVFWCGAMCLRTMDVSLYSSALDLSYLFLYKTLDHSTMAFDVITSCAPLPRGSFYPDIPMVETYEELLSIVPAKMPSPEISWADFVLLVIKGLFQRETFVRAIRVLAMLVPYLPDHDRWNGLQLNVLISYALIPLALVAVEVESSAVIGDSEARATAHRLAQGLHGDEPDLAKALAKFASIKHDPRGEFLASEFAATMARRQSNAAHLPAHCLREFSLCSDSATAKKILQILSKAPKASKSFNRDFSGSWSADSASTIAAASYGVLLSARLETDNKGAVPSCLEY